MTAGTVKTVLTIGAVGGVIGLADSSILNDFTKELTGKTIQEVHVGKELAIFLRDMATGFYSTASDTLERIIPQDLNLDKALFAKTEFYKMCIDNREISAIGFDDTDNFSIKRGAFPQHLSKDKTRSVPSEFILYHNAVVVSSKKISFTRPLTLARAC